MKGELVVRDSRLAPAALELVAVTVVWSFGFEVAVMGDTLTTWRIGKRGRKEREINEINENEIDKRDCLDRRMGVQGAGEAEQSFGER